MEAELGELEPTEKIKVGELSLSMNEIRAYSPIALATVKGKLLRIQGILGK